ncbi:MAG: hypothetical protein M9916_03915 [Crocinitomicaceae bacterium]|nr:hypothetical protein [Crocinitomicaceae bacterium]
MKNSLIIIILGVYSLLGCKKKTEHVIELNLKIKNHMNLTGNYGMYGKKVIVYEYNKKKQWEREITSGLTDNKGEFSYRIPAPALSNSNNKNIIYKFSCERAQISLGNGSSNPLGMWGAIELNRPASDELKKDEVTNVLITYADLIRMGVVFVNSNCFDQNDRIRYRFKYMHVKEGWSNWQTHYGCAPFSFAEFTYNDSILYEYEVERNGVINTFQMKRYTYDYIMPDTLYY